MRSLNDNTVFRQLAAMRKSHITPKGMKKVTVKNVAETLGYIGSSLNFSADPNPNLENPQAFTPEDMTNLAKALAQTKNKNITTLSFKNNPHITGAHLEALSKGLQGNKVLINFDFTGTNITDEDRLKFQKALDKRMKPNAFVRAWRALFGGGEPPGQAGGPVIPGPLPMRRENQGPGVQEQAPPPQKASGLGKAGMDAEGPLPPKAPAALLSGAVAAHSRIEEATPPSFGAVQRKVEPKEIVELMVELQSKGIDVDEDAAVEHGLTCPIGLGIMTDPVKASDGQTYDRAEITAIFASKKGGDVLSPKLHTPMLNTELTPDLEMRVKIADYLQNKLPPKPPSP